MRAIQSKLIPALLLTLTASVSPLSATSVLNVSFDRLSQIARHVISGQVISVAPERAANGLIYSNVSIRVDQAVPQQLAGREYKLRMVGGEMNSKRMYIEGMPQFTVGQEVVLFLNANESSVLGPTVGVWQGVFFIEKDAQTGDRMVVDYQKRPVLAIQNQRLVTGLQRSTTDKGGFASASASSGASPKAMGVESFFKEIRQRRVPTGLQ